MQRKNQHPAIALAVLLSLTSLSFRLPPSGDDRSSGPERFEATVAGYERSTAASPPPPATAIVFYGSSTFTRWANLAADFPGLPVVNRAFGGSEYKDLLHYAGRLISPLKPARVVLYCGGNDIERGTPPETVAAQAAELVSRLHKEFPAASFVVLHSKVAPCRMALKNKIQAFNEALATCFAGKEHVVTVPVVDLFLDASGQPDPSLFEADRLHLNAAGYALLRDRLAPLLSNP